MVVDLGHSRNALRRDDSGLPRAFVGNDAAQMNDSVTHDDAEAEWTPVLLLNRIDDAVANVVVVGGRIGNLAGEACDRLQQVGARNDADELVAAHHGQSLYVVL